MIIVLLQNKTPSKSLHLPLPNMPMTQRWAARAEAVTQKSGDMGNRHRRPNTRSPRFWCDKKGEYGTNLYGITNGGRAQVKYWCGGLGKTPLLERFVLRLGQILQRAATMTSVEPTDRQSDSWGRRAMR